MLSNARFMQNQEPSHLPVFNLRRGRTTAGLHPLWSVHVPSLPRRQAQWCLCITCRARAGEAGRGKRREAGEGKKSGLAEDLVRTPMPLPE